MKGFLRGLLCSLALIWGCLLNGMTCHAQSGYYPVLSKIQLPDGGFNCNGDYRGIKVMMVNKALLNSDSTVWSDETKEAVKEYQIDNNLVISGEVDIDTWLSLGFGEKEWRELGVYTPKVYTTPFSGKEEIIEAVMKTAAEYCDSETGYLKGAAGPPGTYADGVGFLLECLYSAGICPDFNTYDLVLSDCPKGFCGLDEDAKIFSEGSFDNLSRGDVIFFENNTLGIYDKDSMMYYMSLDKAVYTEVSKGGKVSGVKKLFDGYEVSGSAQNVLTGKNIPLCEDSLIAYDVSGVKITPSAGEVSVLLKTSGEVIDVSSVQTYEVTSDMYILMAEGKKAEWVRNNINIGDSVYVSKNSEVIVKGPSEEEEPDPKLTEVPDNSISEGEEEVKSPGPIRRFFEKIINFFRRK